MMRSSKKIKIQSENPKVKAPFSLQDLSFEYWSLIFSFYCCSFVDIISIMLVCKKLNQTCNHEFVWNNLIDYLYINPRWLNLIPKSISNEKILLHIESLKNDSLIRKLLFDSMKNKSTKEKLRHILTNNCMVCHQRKSCNAYKFSVNLSSIKPLTKNSIHFTGSQEPNICFYCSDFHLSKTHCMNHFMLTDSEMSRIPNREMKSNYGNNSLFYGVKNLCILSMKKYPNGIEHELKKKEELKIKKQRIKELKNEIKKIK